VFTYNLNYKEGTIKELLRPVLEENEIDVVATGGLTAQYGQLKEIIDAAREIRPGCITCVGGGIITSDPTAAMSALETADYGIIGEGEDTICELAEVLEGVRDRETVNGLIFARENGKWLQMPPRKERMDLDSLPYPDYEGMEFGTVLDKLPTDIYALGKGRFGFVSFGRSCPFNCTFCFHTSGSKYRKRSMDSVFAEIDYLIEKFEIRNVAVTDELFVRKIEDVREFCARIKARGIGFVISLRVDMVRRDMLELLKDAGCLAIGFGLESADNRILKSMQKFITVEQIDHALGLCREVGLNAMGNFIFGDQEETVETYKNTLKWWREHPQYLIALHLIVLYPGSALYHVACARGLIKDRVQFIKDGCPYINISKLTEEEYRDMALEISMLSQGRTEFLSDTQVDYIGFGKVTLTAKCPHCGARQSWRGLDVFRSLGNIICEECSHVMNVMVSDYVQEEVAENYKALAGRRIAVWPMINAVEEMCTAIPELLSDEHVYFIDSSDKKQGRKYHNKEICAPDIIREKNVDTVFLTVTTSVATEIIERIKKEYPSVEHIFFAGDLVRSDFRHALEGSGEINDVSNAG
jgi:uncharacterized methyltransferase PH0819